MNLKELSKEISYALRHAPWEYELELDEEGFVPIEQLLHALNENKDYDRPVTKEDLEEIIRTSDKKRHEIVGDRIRALYGHSVPQVIKKEAGTPPDILYHGTNEFCVEAIAKDGILPMARQYVHMSTDTQMAETVAKRRKGRMVIMRIDAKQAMADGIEFFVGNDRVWLAKHIPPQYISVHMFYKANNPAKGVSVPLAEFMEIVNCYKEQNHDNRISDECRHCRL